MGDTKRILVSALGKAGLVVTWNDVERLGIHVTKREKDGRHTISWTSVEKLAKDNWPQNGAARERFLERVCNAEMLGG